MLHKSVLCLVSLSSITRYKVTRLPSIFILYTNFCVCVREREREREREIVLFSVVRHYRHYVQIGLSVSPLPLRIYASILHYACALHTEPGCVQAAVQCMCMPSCGVYAHIHTYKSSGHTHKLSTDTLCTLHQIYAMKGAKSLAHSDSSSRPC